MAIDPLPVQSQLLRLGFPGQTGGMKSIVYLIGAGPGDPGLLTLRGAECLAKSDVVLYDGLVNTTLLQHAPKARWVNVGKHGQSRIWKQSEIIDEMLEQVRLGRTVARLKGGDPAVFARTAEEVDALQEAGIPFEIVPGITAALAAGSYAGIPITHRKYASAVALVTGHEEPGKPESAIDWQALARFPGTLVVYMGVTKAREWTAALLAAGKDPETPVALVRRCSYPDQATIRCALGEVADQLTPASRFRPPMIAIVGQVAQLADSREWIGQRPLRGQTILVTRPADQAESMAAAIRDLGGHPMIAPAIEIRSAANPLPLTEAIEELPNTDLLILCSANGVEHFFARLLELGFDSRRLAGVDIAVVGRKTAAALHRYGIHADLQPENYRATALVELLRPTVNNQRVTIIRASRGSRELPEQIAAAGATVREVVAYENVDVESADPQLLSWMEEGKIDWVTVTSSATAENLHRLYGSRLKQCRVAAISPITATKLIELGITVDAVADPHTIEDLLAEVVRQS
jgi:uroporphyrinogen III methyltransferase/synthase